MFENVILPQCLQVGIKVEDTLNYTLKELKMIIKNTEERRMSDLKIQARMDFTNALTQTHFTAMLLDKKAKAPEFIKMYSYLFSNEEIEEYDRKQEQARFRAQMLAYAESFNYKFNKSILAPTLVRWMGTYCQQKHCRPIHNFIAIKNH